MPDFYIADQPWWLLDSAASDGCGAGQRVGWAVPLPESSWLARCPCETLSLDATHRFGALSVSDGSMSGPIACGVAASE